MIALEDVRPAVQVDPAEYARLLGYPRGHRLEGRAAALAAEAEAWYAEHGRPWIFAREASTLTLDADGVRLDGRRFDSARLRQSLVDAGAHRAVLVAVGAGPELEAEAARRWQDEKPDEYFFLEVYGFRGRRAPGDASRRPPVRLGRDAGPGGAAARQPGLPGVGHRRAGRAARAAHGLRGAAAGPARGARLGRAAAEEIADCRVRPDRATSSG